MSHKYSYILRLKLVKTAFVHNSIVEYNFSEEIAKRGLPNILFNQLANVPVFTALAKVSETLKNSLGSVAEKQIILKTSRSKR